MQAAKVVFGSHFSLDSTDDEPDEETKDTSNSSSNVTVQKMDTSSPNDDRLFDAELDTQLRLRFATYVGPLGYPSPNDTALYTRFIRKGTMFRDKQILSYSLTSSSPTKLLSSSSSASSSSSSSSRKQLLLAYEFVLPPLTTSPPEYLYLDDYDVPLSSGTIGGQFASSNVAVGLSTEEDIDRLRECFVRGVEVKELTMSPDDRALLEQFGPSLVNPGQYVEVPIADIIGSEESGKHLFFANQFEAIFKKGKMKALAMEHEKLLEESRASALLSVFHGGSSDVSSPGHFSASSMDLSAVNNLLSITNDSNDNDEDKTTTSVNSPLGLSLIGSTAGDSDSSKRKRGRPAGSPNLHKSAEKSPKFSIALVSKTNDSSTTAITTGNLPTTTVDDNDKPKRGRPPSKQIIKLYSSSTPSKAETNIVPVRTESLAISHNDAVPVYVVPNTSSSVVVTRTSSSPSKIIAALPRLPRVEATSHFADIMSSAFNEEETGAPQNDAHRVSSIGLRLSSSSTADIYTSRNPTVTEEPSTASIVTNNSSTSMPFTSTALISSLSSSTVDAYHHKLSNVSLLGKGSTNDSRTTIDLDDSSLTFAVQATTTNEYQSNTTATGLYSSDSSSTIPNVPHITTLTELKSLTYEEFKLWLNTQIEKRLLTNLLTGLDKQNTLPVTRQCFTTLLSKALTQWSVHKEKLLHAAQTVTTDHTDIEILATNDLSSTFDSSADTVLDQALEEILGIDISSSTGGWYLVAALKSLKP